MVKDKHICEQCGKEFYKYSSHGATKFCSNKCYHDSTVKPKTVAICLCGKVLVRSPFHVKTDAKKFCSQACYHKSRIGVKISEHQKECLARSHTAKSKNNVKCKCLNCGKEYWEWPSNIKHGRDKYCSNSCKYSSEEFKALASKNATGRKPTPETIRKQKARMQSAGNPMYGKPCPHVRGSWFEIENGKRIWLRSSYEIRVANALNTLDINWSYEPARFDLNGNGTYAPDFLINGAIWWEVKGYMRPQDRIKIIKFQEYYPDECLKIIGQRELEQIEYYISNGLDLNIAQIGTNLDEFRSKAHYLP